MKAFILLLLVYACAIESTPAKQKKKPVTRQDHGIEEGYEYEYVEPGSVELEQYVVTDPDPIPNSEEILRHHDDLKSHTGYSVGGSLVSIAQGAANQAHTQLHNQHPAAKQASYVAKNTLAQAAAQSAATAAAALAGKQIIFMGLEQQSREAHRALNGEKTQLVQAQRAAAAAQNSAQQAMHQVQVITAALNAAQATSEHANQAASETAAELASQTTMVGQAKVKLEQIEKQLHSARIDFEATQAAAQKAAGAAQAAQNNAASAAVHAAEAASKAVVEHSEHLSLSTSPQEEHVYYAPVQEHDNYHLVEHANSFTNSLPAANSFEPLQNYKYSY